MMPAFAWLVIAAYIAIAIHLKRKEKEQEDETYFDAAQLSREITALSRSMEELEALDHLIIDLRLLKPEEAMRAFRMQWQSVSGKNYSFDFFADGRNPSTKHLVGMAQDERDSLNQEIIQRIFDLYNAAIVASGGIDEE